LIFQSHSVESFTVGCVPKLTAENDHMCSIRNVNYRFLALAVNFGTQP